MKYTTHSDKETKKLGEKIAKQLKSNIFALTGDLGAGKTTFTQGFAKGLGIKDKIISPTFVLIRQHLIPRTKRVLYHVDLYRLDDFNNLGLTDVLNNPDNIVLIEWAEKAKEILPKNAIQILFKNIDEDTREIEILDVLK